MRSFIPKYEKIADDLREKILSGTYTYNALLPTEHQIMNKWKVSRHTVRKSLEILSGENLIYTIKGSGTYVNFNQNKEKIINDENLKVGVITTYISEYIFPSIIRGIENTFKKNNVTLILASTNNDYENERQSIENLLSNGVNGLIIEPTKSNLLSPNLDYYLKLKKLKVPYVLINSKNDMIDSPYVIFNDYMAGFTTTSHLLDSNHKSIAIITKFDDIQGKERLRGYLRAIESYSLCKTHIYTFNTGEEEDVVKRFIRDINENHITSVVSYNDNVASLLVKHSKLMGISVPDDLSIASIDNSIISENLNITSYSHPKSKLGVKSANMLLNIIYNRDYTDSRYCFDGKLVIRKSVKNL